MQKRSLLAMPAAVGAVMLVAGGMPVTASATLYKFELSNHSDGAVSPPPYGLRLDGLYGNTSDEWTFDFDYTDGVNSSDMTLVYDDSAGGSINISGSVFGGRDNGTGYAAGSTGWWDVDFTYTANIAASSTPTDLTVTGASNSNAGTITRDNGDVFNLVDESNGSFSFKFNDDGHRGATGLAGWGWLTHGVQPGGDATQANHIYASDWLFTGERVPVPLPGTLGLLGLGLLGLGASVARRRR